MATIFDSSTPDVGSGDLFLTDTGKRIQMQAWAVNTLMAQTSLSDTQTVLGIRQQMPNVAFISTADATDEASALALANANKAKINELIQVLINVNLMAASS